MTATPQRRFSVFRAVVREKSFARAAAALRLSPSVVTTRIQNLEEYYNARLLDRSGGSVTLTAVGEVVYEYTQRIAVLEDELADHVAEMTTGMAGTLRVGVCASLAESVLPAIVAQFCDQYPAVRPVLTVANSQTIHDAVATLDLDLGIGGAPDPATPLFAERCGGELLYAVCAADHPLVGRGALDAHTAAEYEYVSRESGSSTRACADAWWQAAGIDPDGVKRLFEMSSPQAIKRAVEAGMGFSLLPHSVVAAELAAGSLVALPADPPLLHPLYVSQPRERFRARLLSSFIDFVGRRLPQEKADAAAD